MWRAIRAHPGPWLLWSGIGFVLFYLLLSFAAASGPSWLIAGTFQLTVIAGMLCAPFLYRSTHARAASRCRRWLADVVVICGVLLMQIGHSGGHLDQRCMDRAGRGRDQRVRVSARQSRTAAAPGARRHRTQRHPARVRHDPGEPAAVVGGGRLCLQRLAGPPPLGQVTVRGRRRAGRGRDRHRAVLPGHRHGAQRSRPRWPRPKRCRPRKSCSPR